MNIDQAAIDTQFTVTQRLTDVALLSPELFRRDARAALKAFTPNERTLIKRIESVVPIVSFFEKWETTLQEKRSTLRKNEQSKSFLNTLQKYLLIEQKDSSHVAASLIRTQDAQFVSQFIDGLSLPDTSVGRKAEKAIEQVLRYSDQHIISLKNHYMQSMVYSAVAQRNAIHYSDPYQGIFSRLAAHRNIKKDRAHSRRSERKALRMIDKEIDMVLQKPLVADILGTHIETVEFFGARAAFEKKVAALSEKDAEQLSIRAELMTKESQHLREMYRTRRSDITSETLWQHDAFFDGLIRSVFSLSTVQKNLLMRDIKKYRSLISQKNEILAIQAERYNIVNEVV